MTPYYQDAQLAKVGLRAANRIFCARFLLCCNSADNGLFESRLYGVELEGDKCGTALDFDSNRLGWGPQLTFTDSHIRVFRRSFPVLCRKSWVGNWCWEQVTLRLCVAAAFLTAIRKSQYFSLNGGSCEATGEFEAGTLITAETVRWWVR